MLKNDADPPGRFDPLAPDGQPFELTELRNKAGVTVILMDWGATWLSAILPLKNGRKTRTAAGLSNPC